jgi:hypothetical protein
MAKKKSSPSKNATTKLEAPTIPAGKGVEYVLAVIASWLLPGAGHFQLGYRKRGMVLCLTVLGLFWMGQALAECRAVNRSIHPILYFAQVGSGFSPLLSNQLWGVPANRHPNAAGLDNDLPAQLSTGILYTTIAGLLNLLLILHVADPRTWANRALEEREERENTR